MAKDVQVGFRISPGEKLAMAELVRRRHRKTGDDTHNGWFREVVRRLAREEGVEIIEPAGAPPEREDGLLVDSGPVPEQTPPEPVVELTEEEEERRARRGR